MSEAKKKYTQRTFRIPERTIEILHLAQASDHPILRERSLNWLVEYAVEAFLLPMAEKGEGESDTP